MAEGFGRARHSVRAGLCGRPPSRVRRAEDCPPYLPAPPVLGAKTTRQPPFSRPECQKCPNSASFFNPDASGFMVGAPILKFVASGLKVGASSLTIGASSLRPEASSFGLGASGLRLGAPTLKPECPGPALGASSFTPEASTLKPELLILTPESSNLAPDAPGFRIEHPGLTPEGSIAGEERRRFGRGNCH